MAVVPATAAAAATGTTAASAALPGLGQTLLSLIVVLLVIFALAAMLKRVQRLRTGGAGGLRIEAGLQVGPKERVLLIAAGDKHLLIGVAMGAVSTLHVFDEPPMAAAGGDAAGQPAPAAPVAQAFTDALKRALGKGDRS